MHKVTDIIKGLVASSEFDEPVVTDPSEIIKGEYHEKDGIWFHSTGRYAGDTAEQVIKKYKLYDRRITAYDYYVIDKKDYDKLTNAKANAILTQYKNVFLVGLYLGGMTEEELINAIQ